MTTVFDTLLFKFQKFLDRNRESLISLLSGILLGRLSTGLSAQNLGELWKQMFDVSSRPLNWSTWLIIFTLVVLLILPVGISRLKRSRGIEAKLLPILVRLKDRSLIKYNTISVEDTLTLQKCPEMGRGWTLSQIGVKHSTWRFQLDDELMNTFQEYAKAKRLKDDNISVMMTDNPIAFTDSPRLQLKTCEVSYNQANFLHFKAQNNWSVSKRETFIDSLLSSGKVNFPNNLAMHIIVATRDKKILITKRSMKVHSFPGKWSCSCEEQFTLLDIRGKKGNAIENGVIRALIEELGITEDFYSSDNIRVFSVLLETTILNTGLCVHVGLNIDSSELSKIIQSLPRSDYEFTDWDYLTYHQLCAELVNPSKEYHPTSLYRMLFELIHEYGEADFAKRFLAQIGR